MRHPPHEHLSTQLTPKGLRISNVTSNPWQTTKLPPCDCDAHRSELTCHLWKPCARPSRAGTRPK
eukprot:7333542-Alexandrium_andersonii.AAC.1